MSIGGTRRACAQRSCCPYACRHTPGQAALGEPWRVIRDACCHVARESPEAAPSNDRQSVRPVDQRFTLFPEALVTAARLDDENTSIHHRGRKTPTHDIVEITGKFRPVRHCGVDILNPAPTVGASSFYGVIMRSLSELTIESFLPPSRMNALTEAAHSSYLNAKPFPHVVFDDLFDPSLLSARSCGIS